MGRLNRRCREPGRACPALTVEPPDPRPYDRQELAAAQRRLESLDGRESSQRDLARTHAGMQDGPYEDRQTPLLSPDDLAGTRPGTLREGSASLPVVREEDLPPSRERITRTELIRLTIPMPSPGGRDVVRWPRLRGATVAPEGTVHHDRTRGARWRN